MNRIKNLIEDIILTIKNKLQSSRYVVKGKCKMCGQCCSNILFSDEKGYIKEEEAFLKLQKRHRIYKNFFPSGRVANEGEEKEGALLFKCKFLGKDNKCKIYLIRPIFCRDYPSINPEFISLGGTTLDNCGYYFSLDKKFSEYL